MRVVMRVVMNDDDIPWYKFRRNILWHKKKILRANEALRLSKKRTDMMVMRNDAAAEFKGEEDSLVAMSNEIQSLKKVTRNLKRRRTTGVKSTLLLREKTSKCVRI